MSPLHFSIAAIPLAMYLLLVGILNLRRRPFLTTGARDAGTLGIAISGLVVAGPMELFFPEAAAIRFGPYVWLMLILFYGLCVTLVVLLMRPRLVVYNMSVDQMRPLLADMAMEVDRNSRWTGETLYIPKLKVQFSLEWNSLLRNVQLVASSTRQSNEGWRTLEQHLNRKLSEVRSRPNPSGVLLLAAAVALVAVTTGWLVSQPAAVAQSLNEFLWR